MHPLNDIVHAHDLTVRLKPLDPHTFNDKDHLRTHHDAVARMAKTGGLDSDTMATIAQALEDHMHEYDAAMQEYKVRTAWVC